MELNWWESVNSAVMVRFDGQNIMQSKGVLKKAYVNELVCPSPVGAVGAIGAVGGRGRRGRRDRRRRGDGAGTADRSR
jgi:hypothetical protein